MTRSFAGSPPFGPASEVALGDRQLRANLAGATATIRAKRNRVVAELDNWEELRLAAEAIKTSALQNLDDLLVAFESNVTAAGGVVHWARDAAEANRIALDLVRRAGASGVVKVKSMTTAETGLNQALEAAGITAYETDLAELIVQLGDDLPSHIVVPAIHRSRGEIRTTFAERMGEWGLPAPDDLTDEPAHLAGAARLHLRERFLQAEVAISGANFLVADTGAVVIVESEGNGRMCLTLPRVLITMAGIDKIIPSWEDLDVFLQVLPRSATGERMNPYTSIWTGVTPGDGPEEFHLILIDNGRTNALADGVGRQALRCIRCAACLNVCPVYERVGGHAYGSVYPGPIGAVLTPQLDHVATDAVAASLPYASSLCGACFDACPVRIDIPRLLVHLRAEVVDRQRSALPRTQEQAAMAAAAWLLGRPRHIDWAARAGTALSRRLTRRKLRLPGWADGWSSTRSVPLPESESFSQWWDRTRTAEDPDPNTASGPVRAARSRRSGRQRPAGPHPAGLRAGPAASGGSAREAVLAGIARAGIPDGGAPEIPRAYRRMVGEPGGRESAGRRRKFVERVGEYRATVTEVSRHDLPGAIAALLASHGSARVVVPSDLPAGWLAETDVAVVPDGPGVSVLDLDIIDSVITSSRAAIAETGTVILDGGPGQGRRAITLVPDHHVVVVEEDSIVARVPDVFGLLRRHAPQTWISGPSATSDIELNRVEGVHGPRHLDVVVVLAEAGNA